MTGSIRGRELPQTALRALPWLMIIAALFVGYLPMRPPATVPDDAPLDTFSAERARFHALAIAGRPHPIGSQEIAKVRDYLKTELDSLGIEFQVQSVFRPGYYGDSRPVEIVNLVARIPGTDDTGAVALVAHYDTVPETSGANDNTTAVATLLEVGRALRAGSTLRNDVILLFTDGEEPGPRYGATAFAAEHPGFADIAVVVNLEATGETGASLLAETSGPDRWLIDALASTDAQPAAFSFLTQTARAIGEIGTDFDEFREAGTPGYHFAYLHGSSIYHTERDNLDVMSLGSLQHHGAHSLGIARYFGSLDLRSPPPQGSSVFFSLPGTLIRYPTNWAVPAALLASAIAAAGLIRREGSWRAALPVRPLVGMTNVAVAMVAATLAWMVIAAMRSTLGLAEGYLYLAGLVALAAAGVRTANARFRPQAAGFIGTLLPLIVLTLLTSLFAVGFSYLFVWPLFAVAAALWIPVRSDLMLHVRFTVVAIVTIILLTPAIDVLSQLAHPRPGNSDSSLPAGFLLPIGLALLTIGILRPFWPAATTRSGR